MAKEFDTSWFDLRNYEPFKTMSVEAWIWQLEAREHYHKVVEHKRGISQDKEDRFLSSIATKLKAGVIPDDPNYYYRHEVKARAILNDPLSTASVNNLSSYEVWRMANNTSISHIWDACKHDDEFSLTESEDKNLFDMAFRPHVLNDKQYIDYWNEALVTINLNATDAQIKNDFDKWLTSFRKKIGSQHEKKLLTQVDFDYWVNYGVIPYLDLVLIAKIEGKKITQHKLARLIFPNEYDVDVVERIRKVSKPTAELLIKNKIYETLILQLAYEKTNGMKNA
ncbi:DUF6387 family protein [Methylotuvimicrobium buryatense]|uniref:Uncharacterized protein n=1 Tax=Methylotuvimicrobium buryatense TaxID=95641 RepID=A0A4P9USX3_METBY|nr:DUF6387 family protein [Methylotuvimicrobium buryatense]QCW83643.1 hypothetical protein EQU24_16390 [Methylotuvimicrobium buryatense]